MVDQPVNKDVTQTNSKNFGWKKREIKFVQFDKEGQAVEGTFLKRETIPMKDEEGNARGTATRITLNPMSGTGPMIAFLCTAILEQQLAGLQEGEAVRIVYKGYTQPERGQAFKDYDIYTQ